VRARGLNFGQYPDVNVGDRIGLSNYEVGTDLFTVTSRSRFPVAIRIVGCFLSFMARNFEATVPYRLVSLSTKVFKNAPDKWLSP
jgi:hypothetical protein